MNDLDNDLRTASDWFGLRRDQKQYFKYGYCPVLTLFIIIF